MPRAAYHRLHLADPVIAESIEMSSPESSKVKGSDPANAGITPGGTASGAANLLRRLKGQRNHQTGGTFATNIALSETSSEDLSQDGDAKPSTEHLSDSGKLERYYVPIDSYEGRHRYDPKARWTPEEEHKIVQKIDWRICSWACLMFFALQLDRGNISQALSDNMLGDLGLTTNDYNTGQTIFFLTFLAAELPSQLISKKLGPDNWISIQMVTWSIVASCQSRIDSRATFWLTRGLMGAIEGGFIPDVILYLSYFYTSKELPIRLSMFWTAYSATFIISAFLAYGILHLDGRNGLHGWQWLFALEGALTGLIGVIS